MNLKIDLQDVYDAVNMGMIPPPHVAEAQNHLLAGGSVTISHMGQPVAKFHDAGALNRYFVHLFDGEVDVIKTEKMMEVEVANLVADMARNDLGEVSFSVGGKKSDYRRLIAVEVEKLGLHLFENLDDRIVFGTNRNKPCTITYLEPQG